MHYFTLEAPIGCGKTSCLRLLQEKYPDFICVPEPIDLWTSFQLQSGIFINPLRKFYSGEISQFNLQVHILQTYRKKILTAAKDATEKNTCIISERSLHSSLCVFCNMAAEREKLNEFEFDLLLTMLNNSLDGNLADLLLEPHIIYLNVPPKTCVKRVKMRNRDGEENYSVDYASDLERHYKEWKAKKFHPLRPWGIYEVDGSRSLECVFMDVCKIIQSVTGC